MLVFLGIAIVALIIIQIVFHIVLAIGIAVNEGDETRSASSGSSTRPWPRTRWTA